MSANTPAALRSRQYATPANLEARIALHAHFSVNPQGWLPWLFEQLEASPDARILELGCGPAAMWRENMQRVPRGWRLVLSDFSPGMIEAARAVFAESDRAVDLREVDAETLPFEADSFDVVIANHMLYHVADRPRALGEIRRVLAPHGMLFASTLSADNMSELWQLFASGAGRASVRPATVSERFCLDNGEAQLRPFFSEIAIRRYVDALRITEAGPVVEYARSLIADEPYSESELAGIDEATRREIARRGEIHVSKDAGVFIARP